MFQYLTDFGCPTPKPPSRFRSGKYSKKRSSKNVLQAKLGSWGAGKDPGRK